MTSAHRSRWSLLPAGAPERLLAVGAIGSAAAALLHMAIIVGGPDWYRFFGAGEGMARRAASGSPVPTIVTSAIALVLGTWALYGLSGAGVIVRLPFVRAIVTAVAAVYLARGVLGVPVVFMGESRYMHELRGKLTFMVLSSVACTVLGLCYGAGAVALWRRWPDRRA